MSVNQSLNGGEWVSLGTFCFDGVGDYVELIQSANGIVTADAIKWELQPPPAPVAKTGQTTSYRTHDDGDLQKGVAWPTPRFTDNGDGTVADNLTGLVWLKDADCAGNTMDWYVAVDYADALYDGCTDCGGNGDCGLSDGSSAGDWRLANVKELQSLLDYGQSGPALPAGYDSFFTNVRSVYYWTSTTHADSADEAWGVRLNDGRATCDDKNNQLNAWPVRGGN